MVGQKHIKGEGGKRAFVGQKYTENNKINSNSENFSESKRARLFHYIGLSHCTETLKDIVTISFFLQ